MIHVVSEFPLKRPDNNQCTNVDHLFLLPGNAKWLFVELKTQGATRPNSSMALRSSVSTPCEPVPSTPLEVDGGVEFLGTAHCGRPN